MPKPALEKQRFPVSQDGEGGWVGGSIGNVCGGIVQIPMSKLEMGQVLGLPLII